MMLSLCARRACSICPSTSCVGFTLDASSAFFFNYTATTEIYTLSLHDALPISISTAVSARADGGGALPGRRPADRIRRDRKSTRLNSSHANISYAVFCLKKKKKLPPRHRRCERKSATHDTDEST